MCIRDSPCAGLLGSGRVSEGRSVARGLCLPLGHKRYVARSGRASYPPRDPVTMQKIPYGRQSVDQSDIDAVTEVLGGDWLTQGPTIEAFERAIADRVGARHAVAFSSGTAGLHACTSVSYTHLRAHETVLDLVCRLLLEKKKHNQMHQSYRSVRTEHITQPNTTS